VNIAGIDRESLRRGIVLARPGTLRSVDVMDVRIRAVASVRHNMHVTFHSGADEANAQLRLLDHDQLDSGDEAWAQLKLETPVAVLRGDRFVIRTPNDTVGGGAIVDIAPKRHRRHHPPTLAALESMLSDSPADRVLEAVAHTPFLDLPTIARELQLSLEATSTAIDELLESGAIVTLQHADGALLATPELIERTRSATLGLLDAHHAAHPLRTGVPLEELRTRLHLGPRALAALIDGWKDVRADATFAARATFAPAPSAAQQAAIDAYLAALRASPERPPSIDLNPDILGFLIDRGDVVDASGGIVFDADAFASMREKVCAYIDQHGAITLAAARDLIGSSRRHAQAFLEHLDRLRVTRRVGEERVLR
jgi:selenocysteine-specific elongation factor